MTEIKELPLSLSGLQNLPMLQSLSARSESASSREDVSDADDDREDVSDADDDNSATSGTNWSEVRCEL